MAESKGKEIGNMKKFERIPKRAKQDKNFPFIRAARSRNPDAYKRYIRHKRLEPFVELWNKLKPSTRDVAAWIVGILTILLGQWLFKLFGLL